MGTLCPGRAVGRNLRPVSRRWWGEQKPACLFRRLNTHFVLCDFPRVELETLVKNLKPRSERRVIYSWTIWLILLQAITTRRWK